MSKIRISRLLSKAEVDRIILAAETDQLHATDDDLDILIAWAEQVRMGSTMLDLVLKGEVNVRVRSDGDVEFSISDVARVRVAQEVLPVSAERTDGQ
jgi:hypothetical protein